MFGNMRIPSSRAEEFARDLAQRGSHIPRFATSLVLEGPIPWLALPKILGALPRLAEARIEVRGSKVSPYNHVLPHRAGAIRLSTLSSRITKLELSRQQFWSTADILYLVASCPQVVSISLGSCTAQARASAAPSLKCTQLTNIYACPAGANLSSLVLSWQWPQFVSDSAISSFPGLRSKDASGVAALMHYVSIVPSDPGTST